MLKKLWPALSWALIILVLTGFPGKYIPSVGSFWDWLSIDKLVHVFIFGTFTFLILYGFREQYIQSNRRYLFVIAAVGVSVAYGLLTEELQMHVFIGRNGNLFDFYADAVGAISGWIVFYLFCRKKIGQYANTNQD